MKTGKNRITGVNLKWFGIELDSFCFYLKQKQNHRHREEIRGCQGGSRGRERRIRNLGLVDSSEK